ncbi:lytic transglycosylase domain-containing protein [Aquabacterium sp. CECT 9606]|uniref:lytic transglycosylase domain-containing protein n=1 Tax=Aquabacterium sp. CECT 9606 TaxID=2845822 RepID=UPI001E36C579|nr:lytic transglycosylase domain-containing protein [Aquabacterium sp. CECT 9606]CAH0348593.1 Membrane-bound lytic murein transglycosylase C [Aquabacterium sp. CECT 9606]
MTAINRDVSELVSSARAGVSLFVQDVVTGLRQVSHNALALLGLAAVAVVVFLSGRDDVRHGLESQVLSWLVDRATARTQVAVDPELNDVLLAMAEPEAIQRATAIDPADLTRQQAAVAYWLSRRYSVAPEPISRLVQEAWDVGRRAGVEPTLILSIMAIESSFNPFAQSHVGAQGLMQVMTRIHHDKYQIFGGQNAAFDPVTNLRVGVQVLKECIQRAGSLEGGLKYYVGAANMANDGGYAYRVLAEQAFLRQVVAGQKVPVNVSTPVQTMVQAEPSAPQMLPAAAAQPHPEAAAVQGGNPGPAVAIPPAALPAAPSASESAPIRRAEQVALAH